jgi:hypothetical protein
MDGAIIRDYSREKFPDFYNSRITNNDDVEVNKDDQGAFALLTNNSFRPYKPIDNLHLPDR